MKSDLLNNENGKDEYYEHLMADFTISCCNVSYESRLLKIKPLSLKRGAVVEWLEQLGYGAESRRIA